MLNNMLRASCRLRRAVSRGQLFDYAYP